MVEHAFRVWQDGTVVAKVFSPTYHDGLREIAHYAHQYEQDGPIKIDYRKPGKRAFGIVRKPAVAS